ncbi:DUF937 domain-containing protein [Rhizobium sp. L1K21]|uniref:DUF937 domain-containing protein n=1 Tax=Rhizobium sp. L1K21 TaxID=2954933 RepID=UPI002091FA4E|nr:DUF937 domain-containing protein [Rhizobium sp. L1K21]MCO6187016.1 DUF937 domain-containing protein [Rhizobium sp. L1K21]
MMPLFDMMAQAQNGKLLEAFSSQMGLAQEQMAQALAALMPAFSSGLKRSAADPANFASIMSSLAKGDYAKYFEDLKAAFSPQGIADGNQFIAQVFGSKEAASAIAEQAAKVTGIGQQALAAMMPSLASTMAGGLFKQMSGQMAGFGGASNPMMDMMNNWLQATGFQKQAKPATPNMFDNPFTQAMQTMFAGAQKQPPKAAETADPFGTVAFMKAMEQMMTGATPKPKDEPKAIDLSQYAEMFNTIFDSGLEVQKSYQKNMEAILDSYLNEKPTDNGNTAGGENGKS